VKVHAEVEEQSKTAKVIIFKKKRRKGYKRLKGHRQPYTLLRVLDVMVRTEGN
jgi:large subunit ribosomal protein L21